MDFPNFPSLSPSASTAILGFVLLSLYYLLRKSITAFYDSRRSPPEAGGAWPIIGHLPLLGGSQPAHVTLGKLADKYGPIFTIRMGVHRALIVSSWEIAKECFTTNDKAFADRPKVVAMEHMAYNYAMIGFSPYGPYWRQLRKITTLELLSNHRIQSLVSVRESEVNAAVKELRERCVKAVDDRALVDMKKWFGDITLNVTMRIVAGKRFGGRGDGDDDRFRAAIREFFRLMGTFVVGDAIPWLRWFDFGGHEKVMKETARELDQILEGLLGEHKEKKRLVCESQLGDGDIKQDFMGVLLSILDDHVGEISRYDSDTIIKSTCLGLILGGTDTISVTLAWTLALLLNNKNALRKAQQELDDQIGRERQVIESDITKLVYLQAVAKESMRLYPPPLLPPRQSMEDCTVAGFHVPAGTRLFVNASKLQRDPSVWSDPNEFRPERFLASTGEHENVDVRGQSFELIPFGSGRRICPAISFSLHVMLLALASLIHGFEMATISDEPIEMRESLGADNAIASSLDVLVTPRLPAEAYY